MMWPLTARIAGLVGNNAALRPAAGGALLDGSESDGTNVLAPLGSYLGAGATLTTDVELAPDGTTTAAFIKEDSSTARHIVYQSLAGGAMSRAFTYSIYAKANGRRYLVVYFSDSSSNSCYMYCDLQTGVVTDDGGGGTGVVSSTTAEAAVNGFYKFTMYGDLGASENNGSTKYPVLALSDVGTYGSPLDSDNPQYAGDNTSGAWVWRPKLVDL